MKIKSTIIDMDDRFNEILPAFDLLNKEFSPRLRIIDIFYNHFSFHSFIKSSKDSFKSCLLLLSDLTIFSSSDSLHVLVVTNASIKYNVTTSIAHIYICNKDIIKMIHYTINILFSEAELLIIRYSINQATNIPSISKIVIITDSLHIARRIFNSLTNSYQKHTATISGSVRHKTLCGHC